MKFIKSTKRANKLLEIKRAEERLGMIEQLMNTPGYKKILEPAYEKLIKENSKPPARKKEQSYEEYGMEVEVCERITGAMKGALRMLPKERENLINYLSANPKPDGD